MTSVALTPLEPWIAAKTGCAGQPLTREALGAYQLAALNETLGLVQGKSAFYRKCLGEERISLTSLEELAQLPLCSADDVRAAPLDFVCVRQDDVERIVTLSTSGTTGPAKRIFFTAGDQELTRDFFHHGMSTMVGPGDRVLILLPGSLPGSVGDLLKDGLARMDVLGIPHGPVTEPRQTLAVIERERVTALVGIPVQVLSLARLASEETRGGASTLHSVLLSTDRTPPAIAEAIERAWGCEVYDHYGTTEMGLGGGVDCAARSGYHLREADLLFEIVDPDTGRPVPEGRSGEVVFTTLTRRAMPLVRYRTGDVARFMPEPCACGTVLRRLAHIEYRLADYLTLPGGSMVRQKDFDELLFPLSGLADFRILFAQGRAHAILTVQVKSCGAGLTNKDEVLQRLRNMPPLSSDVTRRLLSLEVKDWQAGQLTGTGTGKRQIVHIEEGSR
jgi:phenylacetate-CoA ligase